jgi:hypothetical protein
VYRIKKLKSGEGPKKSCGAIERARKDSGQIPLVYVASRRSFLSECDLDLLFPEILTLPHILRIY